MDEDNHHSSGSGNDIGRFRSEFSRLFTRLDEYLNERSLLLHRREKVLDALQPLPYTFRDSNGGLDPGPLSSAVGRAESQQRELDPDVVGLDQLRQARQDIVSVMSAAEQESSIIAATHTEEVRNKFAGVSPTDLLPSAVAVNNELTAVAPGPAVRFNRARMARMVDSMEADTLKELLSSFVWTSPSSGTVAAILYDILKRPLMPPSSRQFATFSEAIECGGKVMWPHSVARLIFEYWPQALQFYIIQPSGKKPFARPEYDEVQGTAANSVRRTSFNWATALIGDPDAPPDDRGPLVLMPYSGIHKFLFRVDDISGSHSGLARAIMFGNHVIRLDPQGHTTSAGSQMAPQAFSFETPSAPPPEAQRLFGIAPGNQAPAFSDGVSGRPNERESSPMEHLSMKVDMVTANLDWLSQDLGTKGFTWYSSLEKHRGFCNGHGFRNWFGTSRDRCDPSSSVKDALCKSGSVVEMVVDMSELATDGHQEDVSAGKKCRRTACNFTINADPGNNSTGHCCNACRVRGEHGPACDLSAFRLHNMKRQPRVTWLLDGRRVGSIAMGASVQATTHQVPPFGKFAVVPGISCYLAGTTVTLLDYTRS